MFVFDFGFKDVVDILLVAFILYETYRLLRRSGATNLFWGILAFIVVWFLVSFVFRLDLTGAFPKRNDAVARRHSHERGTHGGGVGQNQRKDQHPGGVRPQPGYGRRDESYDNQRDAE